MARRNSKAIRKDNKFKRSNDFSSSAFHKRSYFRLIKQGPKLFQQILDVRFNNNLLRTPNILPISHGHNQGGDEFRRILRCLNNKSWKEKYDIIKARLDNANIELTHLNNENQYL